MTEVHLNPSANEAGESHLPAVQEAGVTSAIIKAELDQAITTARAFPRSLALFRKRCAEYATLNKDVAAACTYTLPARKGNGPDGKPNKPISGPSVRMGEIVLSTFQNCTCATRIIEVGAQFVVAQGVFRDLESNTTRSTEVRRRITTKSGARFGDDMIVVTCNAAAAIAARNAIFMGVPKALWADIHKAAQAVAIGNVETLSARRAEAMAKAKAVGATEAQVYALLEVGGISDIGLDHLAMLQGILTAIEDGDTTVAEAFSVPDEPRESQQKASTAKGAEGLAARVAQNTQAKTQGQQPAAGGTEAGKEAS